MTTPIAPLPRPRPARRAVPGGAVLAPVLLSVALAGCAQVEDAARSAAEEAARDAVARATEAAGGTVEELSGSAQEAARRAVDDALSGAQGTCADLLAVPRGSRLETADALLRAFWLSELTTSTPDAATVEAFHDAVVERCEDSRETAAADVVREVWDGGDFAP